MNREIMQWPNTMFYRDRLEASPLVSNHRLSDLGTTYYKSPAVKITVLIERVKPLAQLTDPVLVLVDTSGITGRHETHSNKSYYNEAEAVLVIDHINSLVGEWIK